MPNYTIDVYFPPGSDTYLIESAIRRYSIDRLCTIINMEVDEDKGGSNIARGITRDPEKVVGRLKRLFPRNIRIYPC